MNRKINSFNLNATCEDAGDLSPASFFLPAPRIEHEREDEVDFASKKDGVPVLTVTQSLMSCPILAREVQSERGLTRGQSWTKE